jgi:hypothetical protein
MKQAKASRSKQKQAIASNSEH